MNIYSKQKGFTAKDEAKSRRFTRGMLLSMLFFTAAIVVNDNPSMSFVIVAISLQVMAFLLMVLNVGYSVHRRK